MVYQFLQKQTERPFLKRYLKRDEILRQISGCDASLSGSVSAFSVRLLPSGIRILKQVQALNSRMISNSNFIAPGVRRMHIHKPSPKNLVPLRPPCLKPKPYLPTPTRSAHGYMPFAGKRTNAMQGLILLICVS
jgi:hypothetical protein